MGGNIEVSSTTGMGTRVSVTLPAAEQASPQKAPRIESAGPVVPPRQRVVLYVEDDPVNVEVMRAVLGARPQYSLLIAHNLAGGISMVKDTKPDLVLLDMQLPDGPGVDLLRMVRQDAQLRATPVVIVSADLFPEGVSTALRAGANAYLSKPYDFDAVLSQIDTLLA
jgi:CheY-like chemotaxis protein